MQRTKNEKAAIGLRLREARDRAKLSREEAADAAGVQLSAIQAWERGSALPNLIQLRDLLATYGVTAHQVLFGRMLVEFSEDEARELARAARDFSPKLRAKIDLVLSLAARSKSPALSS